jgi:phosphoribosylcarboxyaminoimidazole (NCAIR) mutase
MSKGIPAATVAIDNATNTTLLSLRILSLSDKSLQIMLNSYREIMMQESRVKTKKIKVSVDS